MIDGTEEHPVPKPAEAAPVREALVIAYPAPLAVSIPPSGSILGRDWLATFGVVDKQISGAHARLTRPGGVLSIEDVGSRNGTWVNGYRLKPGERLAISDGAVVRLGGTLLVVRERFAGDSAPSPPIGALIGPFGLRAVADALDGFLRHPAGNLLVEGETGTGKELLAAEIARRFRPVKPYVPVNVAGVPAGVFESQLFGYVPGAFSGAGRGAPGILLSARGGTVFLDEIGELALDLQTKLLRVLENREVLSVGADRPVAMDVLLVAATNRSLDEMANAGTFRRDLLARFGTARIKLPPLRERSEDVFAIASALAAGRGAAFAPNAIEVEAVERLLLHPFEANVRELGGVVDAILRMAPRGALPLWAVERVLGPTPAVAVTGTTLTEAAVRDAIAACAGNESKAAARLGVTRAKLRRFLEKRGK